MQRDMIFSALAYSQLSLLSVLCYLYSVICTLYSILSMSKARSVNLLALLLLVSAETVGNGESEVA